MSAPPQHAPPASQAGAAPVRGHEAPPRPRLHSVDALRGLAIAVMLIAMHPGPGQHDPAQLRHPEWHGLTFVDLFFPLFLFVVGISMTLSPRADDVRHVLRRAAILVVLGIGLASLKHERFGLTGVLQHIAGAYLLAFAVLRAPRRWHAPLAAAIVGVVWAGFVVWAWGDDPWGQSGTLAHAVDTALLGGFTSEGTLQTVISAATVVGGSLAGRLIQDIPDPRRLAGALALRAGALLGLALVLSLVVPINKRLWTPSFTVLTLATSWALLAAGVRLVDASGRRRWVAPLVHLGANPIAIYVLFMASLALLRNYGTALTPELTVAGSPMIGALVYATGWATLWWLFAYLLYRHRVHIKI